MLNHPIAPTSGGDNSKYECAIVVGTFNKEMAPSITFTKCCINVKIGELYSTLVSSAAESGSCRGAQTGHSV